MASQLTLVIWTDHPADTSLAADLAAQAASQIFRSSSMQAAVISAVSVDIQVHDIVAAVNAFAAAETPEGATVTPLVVMSDKPNNQDGTLIPTPVVTADMSPVPAVVVPPAAETAPAVVQPDVIPPAVVETTTAASAGLVAVPDPSSPVVGSDEHTAVLVKLFEALTQEQKDALSAEVHSLEDAHAALENIYAPLVALETPTTDTQAPPAP